MNEKLRQWISDISIIPEWTTEYDSSAAQGDVIAGITVGVMLIPQGMAHAVIAGLPPIYGLYAALVPLIIYPFFASSRHLAIGPSAVDMVIVAAGVGAIAQVGSDQYIALAILLTLMVGVIQLLMGVARLGFVASLLSRPVIAGLTFGAALIIGFSQFDQLLGIDLPQTQYVYVLLYEAVRHIGEVHLLSLGIGLGSIVLLVAMPYIKPAIPAALVVVVLGTLAGWFFAVEDMGVRVIGDIPAGLPAFTVPALGLGDMQSLLSAAIALALVQFMKNVSLGRVFAARHNYTIDANRVLISAGMANIVGSFFRSPPAGGSFSRTAVNEQSGAQTPVANIVSAGIIALTLLFLTPLFYYLPMPVLAAIIMVAGFSLIDVQELRELLKTNQRDGYIALFTAGCVLVVGIQEGILLGIVATVIAVLYRISRPNMVELGHVPGARVFRDINRFEDTEKIDKVLVLRVDASFSFANADHFKDFILEKTRREKREIRAVVIDGTSINALDTTATDALWSVIETLEDRGIALYFAGLIGPVRKVVIRAGLFDKLGEERFHLDPHEAVEHILEQLDDEDEGARLSDYRDNIAETDEPETPDAA
ncbi:MAG: sulfate permease [Longimonas sp.]|uniref:SulP family inorganic anion transporter n=1 Tax=Longimonas sp. TaxID=2039626 RepID=UPI0033604097